MCRFAGIVDSKNPSREESIIKMRDSMFRGGPDDHGLYLDDRMSLAFGFRRLSIIDLSIQGHQPMSGLDGQVVLMFNGEIYNFRALRKELASKGYKFRSTSDTEVVLYSYLEWGKDCFVKFNGMFAIAIYDKRSNVLILVRDHAGIKPLYYCVRNNSLFFASEVRAFKALQPNWAEHPDWKKAFLIFGFLPAPFTTLQNVVSLPKGSFVEVQLNSFATTLQLIDRPTYKYSIYNKNEAVRELSLTLEKAVERHLISDAPIGLFLSGGLDSSILTLLARKYAPQQLQTLSIDFEDQRYSESYYQELIINRTGANHQSFTVTKEDFLSSLPDILCAMDQPSHDGINTYFISKFANSVGLKVALSGLGADELLGGYPSFQRSQLMNLRKWIPEFIFHLMGYSPNERLKKIKYLSGNGDLGFYLFNRGFFHPRQVAEILGCSEGEVKRVLKEFEATIPDNVKNLLPLERVSYLEVNFYMQNQLLKDSDYMGMWHGLEIRVPFLDKELMELIFTIDPTVRYSPSRYKYLLIQTFQHILPTEILHRPKQGFTFPFEDWMRDVDFGDSESDKLVRQLNTRKIHWSRYWSYKLTLLSNQHYFLKA